MKLMIELWKKYCIWWVALFSINLLSFFLLWVATEADFFILLPTAMTGSLIIFGLVGIVAVSQDRTKEREIAHILETPELWRQEKKIFRATANEQQQLEKIITLLRTQQEDIQTNERMRQEYEEYIESWAHEIKTPLALMTFVLDNRREEISPVVYTRLEYARTKIQEDLDRMLTYARMQSAKVDFYWEFLSIKELWQEITEEYMSLLEEKGIVTGTEGEDVEIFTDRKGFLFLLRQAVSNAIKYQDVQKAVSKLTMSIAESTTGEIQLCIGDNGVGAAPYDLPFLLDKGFTGSLGDGNKNATGMGLYLANQMAEDLKITVEPESVAGEGFVLKLTIPRVEKGSNNHFVHRDSKQ